MSDEIQAAGAAATAGLVAGAIERGEGHEVHEGPCANCGAHVSGRYCANCGQPAHVHRSLAHMAEEALHGIVHFDSKMWRTLPRLAFRPGTLTRDYIDGKRARFVSPLALFLFCIFAMFFAFAFMKAPSGESDGVEIQGQPVVVGTADGLAEARDEIAADRAKAVAEGDTEEAAALGTVERVVGAAADSAEKGAVVHAGDDDESVSYRATSVDDVQAKIDEEMKSAEFTLNTGDPKRDIRLKHALENVELTLYKIQQAAYKFAFLLVPISLPLIALMFLWKRGVTWFDHAVFALYSLSFMSLFYLVGFLALRGINGFEPFNGLVITALTLVPPVHMFFQLGGAYKLGWFSALWRTIMLLTICGFAFLAFLIIIVLIGVLG